MRERSRARRSLRAVFLRPPSSSTALAVRDALDRRLQAPLSACWTAAARAAEVVRAPTRSNQTADTNVSDLPRKHRERASLRHVCWCTLAEQGCSSSGDALASREALAAVQTASLALLQAQSVAFATAGRHATNVLGLLVSYSPLAPRLNTAESLATRRARLRTLAFVAT